MTGRAPLGCQHQGFVAQSCCTCLHRHGMAFSTAREIVPIFQARARLTELADDVSKSGNEKVFTKNGESCVALITAGQLDDHRRCKEAEHASMLRARVDAAEDIEAGRVYTWDEFKPRLAKLRARAQRIAEA